MNYPILVLGASDELIIPDFECKEVFTCNSSAIKGKIYKNKFNRCIHTNVTPAKAFYKIEEIRNSVLESSPENLISRIGNIDYRRYDQLANANYQEFSQKEQINFQKKFLKKNIKKVKQNFSYTSGNNKDWMTKSYLKKFIKNNDKNFDQN